MTITQKIPVESAFWSRLICPQNKQPLDLMSLQQADAAAGGTLTARAPAINTRGEMISAVGRTPFVLLRQDRKAAYPVMDGIPVLLIPEMLTLPETRPTVNLLLPQYAEAYEEMTHYNHAADQESLKIETTDAFQAVLRIHQASPEVRAKFPYPPETWLDAIYDSATQMDAYEYLTPIAGKKMLQLGGKGIHAVKFLLAGAAESWAITPMIGEIKCAIALAKAFNQEKGLFGVVGIAEEIPLVAENLDGIFSGGCLHHMQTQLALPDAARVLKKGGRFAANDPWRTPFYAIGTRIFGKREKGVFCQPLTQNRLSALASAFHTSCYIQHGSLFRYPLLALSKFGIRSGLKFVYRATKVDDAISTLIPGLRRWGSSVVVLGEK